MPGDKTPEQMLEEQKANCPFCKIVKGDFPAKKIYEDDKIVAVLDINPAAKGHALVLPKEHYPIITMMPPETFSYLFEKTAEITKSLQEAMVCKGIQWFIASGAAAGQQVPHFMIHVVPRDDNDGLSNFDLKKGLVTEEQMKEISEKIKQGMAQVLGQAGAGGEVTKEKLIGIIEQSPQLKEALLNKTEEFKKMVAATPQLQALFKNFDVDEIAAEMKGEKKPADEKEKAEEKEESEEKEEAEEEKEEKEKESDEKEDEEDKEEDVKDLLGGGKEESEQGEEEEKEEETDEDKEESEDESDDEDNGDDSNDDKGGANLDLISKLF